MVLYGVTGVFFNIALALTAPQQLELFNCFFFHSQPVVSDMPKVSRLEKKITKCNRDIMYSFQDTLNFRTLVLRNILSFIIIIML